ncbi:MAG: asparagine synthetase B, partial [Candidatus Latescibacteria bacterium]|nr:asparagine synthetase B [Candidatus Latescibacterota bacterium]NIO77448.1 asparagine synthetase B [Candidatus Latescibacterota bacterium]
LPSVAQQKLLIPMDLQQTDHLKAYGIAYYALTKNVDVDWLLNYRGGSFLINYHDFLATECRVRGVRFEALSGAEAVEIFAVVENESSNMD